MYFNYFHYSVIKKSTTLRSSTTLMLNYLIWHRDIFRSALCCHSNKPGAPIANLPNSAQLEGTPTIPLVCAVVSECGKGRTDTDRQTDGRDQYTFRLGYASRKM